MHRVVSGVPLEVEPVTTTLTAPVRLTAAHAVDRFACGDPVLDDWLRRRALRRDARGSRTFASCADADRVAGFFCLAAGLVAPLEDAARPRPAAVTPLHEPVPVAILRRLAVDRDWQGRGLGADLLRDALQRVIATGADLGVRAILARAVEGPARAFYAAFGFSPFVGDEESMILPIETAEAALRAG